MIYTLADLGYIYNRMSFYFRKQRLRNENLTRYKNEETTTQTSYTIRL